MRLEVGSKKHTAIKLWLTMMITLVCVLVGVKPVQAYEDYTFLYIDGTYMIKDGKLLTNKVTGGGGTAVYDEENNTLMLDNFTMTSRKTTGIAFQFMGDFKIILKGTNTLDVSVEGVTMGQPGKKEDTLKICGDGVLKIRAGSWEEEATGIRIDNASLMIEDCDMDLSASYGAFCVAKNLTMKNSDIKVIRTGYAVVNDPNQNNNIYNIRYGFPAVSVGGVMTLENSTVDATGINYGISLLAVPTLNGKTTVTDGNGNPLNLVKMHWPASWMNGNTTSFDYAYSTSTSEDVYSFDELPNRVIIKAQREVEKPVGNATGDNGILDVELESGEKCWTVNNGYYIGKASTGKVAYAGPVNKNTTKITIPPTVTVDGKVCKVTSIQKSACKDCKKLKTATIGKNVTTIGEKAFYNCKNLKTVTIGAKVKTIGEKAFYQCSVLTKVTLPASVTTIKKEAFAKCTKLGSVTIKGKKLRTVGTKAFKDTKKKIKVTVPKSKYKSYKKLLKNKGLKSPVYKKK